MGGSGPAVLPESAPDLRTLRAPQAAVSAALAELAERTRRTLAAGVHGGPA
jgi:hypothetical protein